MVNGIVIGVALFGLIAYPFAILTLYQLFAEMERDDVADRDEITPPPANDATPSRTMPGGGSRRAD